MPNLSTTRKYPSLSGACKGVVISGLALVGVFGSVTCTAVAGDLLRGGYNPSSQGGSSSPNAFIPASATQARQNAQDVLARTTQAVQAVTAMQSAARKLALSGGNNVLVNPKNPSQNLPIVPNGLNIGGLVPGSGLAGSGIANPVTTWTGATTPTQAVTSNGNTVVTVVQTAPDAVLTWSSFNIGKGTTLNFNQSKGGADATGWAAFNIITDPSGNPTQILGSIRAPGQVYVINQNGIIFGGSSQVNVHTLVASSLPIDTYLIKNGLLNNPDAQFLFSALAQPLGPNGSPAFTPPAAPTSGQYGDVMVEAGAILNSPASVDNVGGRIALVGANVTNAGTINTPDGQTILAAGLQVGFVAHPSDDPSLRGLDVFVGAVGAYAGTVTNSGLITVPEGDVMIVGKTVNQLGDIYSSTSVSLNGRIDILADYNSVSNPTPTSGSQIGTASTGGDLELNPFLFLPTADGSVTLGANSTTEILPEIDSLATVVPTQQLAASSVNLQGNVIHMASDSTILAPSATINLDAGSWVERTSAGQYEVNFVNSSGQIYLDSGAIINAAGSADVAASVAQNIVSAQLRGTELADDPLQRFGVLRGQTVQFDIREQGVYDGTAWIGSPVANLTAYANLVEETIGELTVNGGKVNLSSGGSIVMQPGSSVNVSGGYIDYAGANVQTTQLVSNGHIYDISQATPDMIYQGIFTGQFTVAYAKYGLTDTFTDPIMYGPHFEDGYVYGGNAGQINLMAPSVALDGQMLANTVTGPRQLNLTPAPGGFSLTLQGQSSDPGNGFLPVAPAILPTVVIEPGITQMPVPAFALDNSGNPLALPAARQSEVVISPDLTSQDGFGAVTIDNGSGKIIEPDGVAWNAPATVYTNAAGDTLHTSITLEARNISIDGSISVPGGNLSFTAYNIDPDAYLSLLSSATQSPAAVPGEGNFLLGSNALLNTSGLIVDNRFNSPDAGTLPQVTSGGSVTIDSFSAKLQAGSVINVSGGLLDSPTGRITYGNGGSITVQTGADPELGSVLGGHLSLGSTLEGYSGAVGGSLALQASMIQIGGATSSAQVFLIDPTFFSQGGFASFTLSGLGAKDSSGDQLPAILIAPGTQISPVVTGELAVRNPSNPDQLELIPELLPVGARVPASLTFKAPGVTDKFDTSILIEEGNIVMGAGSRITTDPGGSVSVSGNTVGILGSIIAPAGAISISGNANSISALLLAHQTTAEVDVVLAPGSLLSTAGAVENTPNAYGYQTGIVLRGGNIVVTGNILAESGAVLNVSGASGMFDLPATEGSVGSAATGSLDGAPLVLTEVDSSGGTITLQGSQELFTDATLIGNAGGPSAVGGTLTVSSGHFYPDIGTTPHSSTDITLDVTQSGPAIPSSFTGKGLAAMGQVVLNQSGAEVTGGNFAVNAFQAGGFDNLNLNGVVQFKGSVNIDARGSVSIGSGGVIFGDGARSSITITASYVDLGLEFQTPQPGTPEQTALPNGFAAPTYGLSSLTVNASLIDVGNLSLEDIGHLNLIADNGDIRGDGSLDVAGSVYMRAGQIYPPTETTFTIAAYDYNANGSNHEGSVTIVGSGTRQLPLSAGGTLNVFASIINQGGTLRAPFGTINLGWDGQGAGYIDPVSGETVAVSQTITLKKGSVTSVSAIDPTTGEGILIPYGIVLNDKQWIDPSGTDITAGGVPAKKITISGLNVNDQSGALIDLRGGGDLYAYQFVPGAGGSSDILAENSSFAIIPGYSAGYSPYAPYFNTANAGNNPNANQSIVSTANSYLAGDLGYVNGKLTIGSQVYLTGVGSLATGYYTLLPARYANIPGAYLVTPQKGSTPSTSTTDVDGSYFTSGYSVNGFDAPSAQPLAGYFQVQPQTVVQARAEYDGFTGSGFLLEGAVSNHVSIPRLPVDAGQLVLEATQSMTIEGQLEASAPGGQQGLVDITTSNPNGILIAAPGSTSGGGGQLVLDASALSNFGAGSLLIGGLRNIGVDGTLVDVATSSITVAGGAELRGADIILAANNSITVESGAQIASTGAASNSNPSLIVKGNGVLLRVSGDIADTDTRTVDTSAPNNASLVIAGGAMISGASVTLDSSAATNLDPKAIIQASALNLSSGQITVELSNPGSVPITSGLLLTQNILKSLQSGAASLSLLSYSSIDFYGSGQIGSVSSTGVMGLQSLSLNAGEIRGFNNGGGSVTLAAQQVTLANSQDGVSIGAAEAPAGSFDINAGVIEIGPNQLAIDQFASVNLNASSGIVATASGEVSANGAINLTAPLITGQKGSVETIAASGNLTIALPAKASGTKNLGGLGATITFIGAGIDDNGKISASSGTINLKATSGNVVIGDQATASLDVAGSAQSFFDLTKYTSGGVINLTAQQGNISISAGSTISVAAQAGGGNAGTVNVSAANGSFSNAGTLDGHAAAGTGGSFSMDVGTLPVDKAGSPDLNAIDTSLALAGFNDALSFRIRSSDVTISGAAAAQSFTVSADDGNIDVTGNIDVSGNFGGTINLFASGNVTLESGAVLNASAQNYDNAGKGGAVSLESTGGLVAIDGEIDLGVKNAPAGPGKSQDATGTLYIRAPQLDSGGNILAANADPVSAAGVDVAPITGVILGASSVVVEGHYVQAADTATANIDDFESAALANATAFMANSAGISSAIAGSTGLTVQVRPGEEIDNTGGNLVLQNDWNLAQIDPNTGLFTYRFGSTNSDAGTLTMRAAGNLIFNGALSDGFNQSQSPDGSLWQAPLLAAGSQSWSYRLVSGADFSSANYLAVVPTSDLPAGGGSLELGQNDGTGISTRPGSTATTSSVIQGFFQVIRTGVGNISIATGGDLDLLNQFATIYTAGTPVADPGMNGTFQLPVLNATASSTSPLGSVQENSPYPAQYSYGGGNLTIQAQGNISHLTENTAGQLVADSEKELPVNWLYRRGYVDTTGQFGVAHGGDIASTTWWVDFSNFFEGVGTLGGGNVTMTAGGSINNVDAVIPTNARMPMGTPSASSLVELGGGDLTVRAGQDINGGVYYVENGAGILSAGANITTNATRSPSLGAVLSSSPLTDPNTWLPTTLFLGNGSFNVSANDDLELGPVANVFLLPEGYSNTYWYKTYFSTYGANDSVDVSSLTGNVTLREYGTLPLLSFSPEPLLEIWLDTVSLLTTTSGVQSVSDFQPWLRLDESKVIAFVTNTSIMPPTLRATSFSGDVNVVGNLTLAPSPTGTVQIAAAGSINGLQATGLDTNDGNQVWASAQINLSDANPDSIPQVTSPFAYQAVVGTPRTSYNSGTEFLQFITDLFNESGSTQGQFAVLQTQEELNAPGILHASDSAPLQIYANAGDISGITLFSPKQSRVLAGTDITDIALYIQNTDMNSLSIVSAGRDILPYDPSAPLMIAANSVGNDGQSPLPGDIQINGPGTIEVLAGHDITLGASSANADPTLGLGVTSIGNARNPYLPFGGAGIIMEAGLGGLADGMAGSTLDFKTIESDFISSTLGAQYLSDLAQTSPDINVTSVSQYDSLTQEQKDIAALELFYIVLRDAGREHNLPGNPGYGNYAAGMQAISTLFGAGQYQGDIDLTSREVKTESGGDINILVPGGQINVGVDTGGSSVDQGILTQDGGNISIFANGSVNIGTSRIFTLRGGNEIIWSTAGNIDAGASPKTVQSAPPTRVLVNPQNGEIETDLAGLATGGGIGVLATVAGVPPGSVDLIAPSGIIDAGDAGIRATGNLNLAAVQVLNASNIQAGGASSGVPTTVVAAPNLGAISAASSVAAATDNAATDQSNNQNQNQNNNSDQSSIIDVQVIGYGGGDSDPTM